MSNSGKNKEKNNKVRKINILKILLFISITLSIVLVYKLISCVQKFGPEVLEKKEYTEISYFNEQIKIEIQRIEHAIYNSVWENYIDYNENFNYINRQEANIEYIAVITTTSHNQYMFSNLPSVTDSDLKNFKEYYKYYICSLNSMPDTNINSLLNYGFKADQSRLSKLDVYIRVNFDKPGYMSQDKEEFEQVSKNSNLLIGTAVISTILSIILLIVLTKKEDKTGKDFLNTIYQEVIISLLILGVSIKVIPYSSEYIKLIIYLAIYFICENIYFAIVRKIKNRGVKKEQQSTFTFIYKIKKMHKLLIAIIVITILGIAIVMYIRNFIYLYNQYIILGILIYIAIVAYVIKFNLDYIELEKNIKNIANGDYQTKLESKNKFFKDLAYDINNIRSGIEEAVNEKVKSERLKTDLITNVSHDLKTPLTSIINYTNLLKKENIENENAKKYIEILENKSKKLKNLTEDLIEASKITSGNETVTLQKLNFAEMILQANGEFAEKFDSKELKIIANIQKDEIYANLDSKKMWRVLENIYNNIYKYAQEKTRVYVDLKQNENNKIQFTIKNISKEELNITPDELMERFVRGDKSRTTGGNGLRTFNCKRLSRITKGKTRNTNTR